MYRVRLICAGALLALPLATTMATAAPLYNVSMLASTSQSGPYSSDLTVTPGTTYYYEFVGQLASIGASNAKGTIASKTAGVDGANSMSFSATDAGANSIQISFLTKALANTSTTPASAADWNALSGASAGSIASAGGGTSNQLLSVHGAHPTGVYTGATSADVIEIGTFSVPAGVLAPGLTSLVALSYGTDSSAIRINGAGSVFITTTTEAGSDPIVGYVPLTLHTAPAPEPSSIVLAGMAAAAGLAVAIRRRKKA